MDEAKLQTVAQVKAFLDGRTKVTFRVAKEGQYGLIERVLKRHGYARHERTDKGMLRRYLGLAEKVVSKHPRIIMLPIGEFLPLGLRDRHHSYH